MHTILYVDDEPSLLEIGKLFLERGGEFSVDVITSAPAALALMDSKNFDAIIADYQMPGMDGIEFLKKVRSSGNMVPFILFTGRGREEVVIQALNEGADFYLQKGGDPVSQFTELAHQVRRAVRQRKADASIRDLEQRQADLINFLPDATFAIDRSGRVIAWNHAIEEMTGVPAAEMLGKGEYEYAIPFYGQRRPILIDLISEPDERIAGKYGNIVRRRDTLVAETTLPRPRGKPATLMGKAGPLYNRKGEIVGAIESIRDISDRKQAEEKIQESEKFVRDVISSAKEGIFVLDRELRYVIWNTLMEDLSGIPAGDLLGKKATEVFPRLKERGIDLLLERALSGETVETLDDWPGIDSRGAMRWVRGIYSPQYDPKGNIAGVIGVIRDVTVQREMEARVKESEERFRRVFETSPLGMALSTPDLRFYSVNPAWVSMTGYPEEELLKMSFTDITHPEHLAGDVEQIRELAEGKIPVYSAEKRYVRRDKSILWGLIRVTAIRDQQGTLRYFAAQIEDITERKRAEDELRQSEERYRNVVEDQTEFISRFLPDGTHVFVNEAYCRYFGMERGEILGHRFRPEIPPEDRERMNRFFASLTPENPVGTIEHRIVMPGGEVRWQQWSDRAVFDGAGRLIEYQSVGRDITELRRADELARVLARIVDDAPASITVHDSGGNFLYANEETLRMHGYTRGEFLAKNLHEIDVPESGQLIAGRVRLTEERGEADFDVRHFRRDGSTVPLHVNVKTIQWGGREAMLSIATDITGRKQAEDAVKQSEEHYRGIFENAPVGIFHSLPEGKILDVNPACARIFGYDSPGEVIEAVNRTSIAEALYVHPEKRPDYIRGVVESDRWQTYENLYRRKDGSTMHGLLSFRSYVNPLNGRRELEGFVLDISDRKQAEEALREANKKLGLLSSITRHDINNQLAILQGYTRLAELSRPDPVIADFLARIGMVAETIQYQIEFTRTYQDLGMRAPAWFRVCEVIRGVRPPAIALSCSCDAWEIFADPMIAKVFSNLFENAVQYGEGVTTVTAGCGLEGDGLVITFADDGAGIAAGEKEKIFEKGYGHHTGLGLFLAREILAITGISIGENGEPGAGARFVMTVPKGAYRRAGAPAP